MTDDGISLTSIAHPRGAWYSRMYCWLFAPKLNDAALEEMEIEIMTSEEKLLTLRVTRVEGDCITVTCDEVPGLFIATKSFEKSMQQIGPCLATLAFYGTKVPGINDAKT